MSLFYNTAIHTVDLSRSSSAGTFETQGVTLGAIEDTRPSLPLPSSVLDDRLSQLDISYWTVVPIDNESAASLISQYIMTDHALLPSFDADLFLQDLVSKTIRFCSPLLVNALLAWASVSSCWESQRA